MLIRTLAATVAFGALTFAAPAPVTFHKDVLPVLQKRCQTCHRPGEVAPMSFLSYGEVRPWAKSIKQAVLSKKMPPWFADPQYGKFHNNPSLSQQEIDTLIAWVDNGTPEGNAKDAPKPVAWVTGWGIGKPDVILRMPTEFKIPESGTVRYQNFVVPSGFTEDKWVQMAEARPGNRAQTHHIVVSVREPVKDEASGSSSPARGGEIVAGYAPGTDPVVLPSGTAKLVKAGSDFIFQMHYTPNGKGGTDLSELGLVFAKDPVKERVYTTNAGNMSFAIPPGDPNYEVKATVTLQTDTRLVDFNPHMHLRGKDFEFRIVYPTGESEIALKGKYDFKWQLYYRPVKPIVLPAGTRIDFTAHFDNSANNPSNPDPTKTVRWGEQSWEEMCYGWFDVAFDVKKDPMELRVKKQPGGAE